MTSLAVPAAPLRRLFERLDFAPRPLEPSLRYILEQWQDARRNKVAPRRRDLAFAWDATSGAFFLHRHVEGERDYVLVEGEGAAAVLLGPCERGERLSAARERREAVRLRRLFDEVRRVGEPLLAEFIIGTRFENCAAVELVVAPLSENGKTIDAVLAARSVRPIKTTAVASRPQTSLDHGLAVFAIGASRPFGEAVAGHLAIELTPHEEREFEDGEHKMRPLASVRGRDVYVLHSLHRDSSQSGADKLCRLLFFLGALKDAGASRVTAVVPYLCYARKDRQTKPRDPVITRYVAQLFEAVGTDRMIVLDVHNVAAFQNAFRCDTEHLDAQAVFARHFSAELGAAPIAVVSPDLGGEKRAELFRQRLEATLGRPIAKGFMDKHRSMGQVSGEIFAGDVAARTVIILDDLISTGGTMVRTAVACRKHGAAHVWLAATHGLFASGAESNLRNAPVDKIVVTDSVPLPPGLDSRSFGGRLSVVSVAGLIAETIRRCHTGGSIVDLLEHGPSGLR